ncbi:type VI secretion system baseplate subunit TssG [Massilia sp. TS11]|uniref:type VI secretion system baseplate subunit TssG n=1 Tax=Massilia sp. TS11 TaxID=2908003 RepID=UPI001EDA0CE1|nr:type VI secretion system baseplate subunit TssG [Massilia sp. TS11]MCG2586841.1 type VI secretion system baseplate subunit TssG [Massilia sp. TS11]
MPSALRNAEPSLISRLELAPYRYPFFQLISLLLRHLALRGVPYERAFDGVIRFRNSLSLTFPASEIQSLVIELDNSETTGFIKGLHITPAFIGLLGVMGSLPLHDTERLLGIEREGRGTGEYELVNLVSNRMIGLFYEAQGKYRVEHSLQIQGIDSLLPKLAALAGYDGGGSKSPLLPMRVMAFYAAQLRSRPLSKSSMERILSESLGVTVSVESFAGTWVPIPETQRSDFSARPLRLGFGVPLGKRIWRCDTNAVLHIGPVDEGYMRAFFPGGDSLSQLSALMALFAVPGIAFEAKLHLRPSCIRPIVLSRLQGKSQRLGWNTFLTTQPGVSRKPELRLNLDDLGLRDAVGLSAM